MERSFQSQEDSTEDLLVPGNAGRGSRQEELARISPLFRKLDAESRTPSPQEWKAFSDNLALRLEEESRKRGAAKFAESLRDIYTATDSTGLRILILVCALFAVAGIAAAAWLVTMLVLDTTAKAMAFSIHPAPPAIAWQKPAEIDPFTRSA